MEQELKQRNGCISVWLWFSLIANIATCSIYAVTMFDEEEGLKSLGIGLCSMLSLLNILGIILLFRWVKRGFHLFALSSVMSACVNLFFLQLGAAVSIGGLLSILIWWAILQAKKEGVSVWNQLQPGWDVRHCRHVYQVFAAMGGIILLLAIVASIDKNWSPSNPYFVDEPYLEELIDSVEVDEEEVPEILPTPKPQKQETPSKSTSQERKRIEDTEIYDSVAIDPGQTQTPSKKTTSSDSGYDKYIEFIKMGISEFNSTCPQEATVGMIITKAYIDGDYMIYYCECDEDLYSIDQMETNRKEAKSGIVESLRGEDQRQLIRMCVNARKGIGYKYVGTTSQKTCIILISCSELKGILGD